MESIDSTNPAARRAAERLLSEMAARTPDRFAVMYDAYCPEAPPDSLRRIMFGSNAWQTSLKARTDLDILTERYLAGVMKELFNPERGRTAYFGLNPLRITDRHVLQTLQDWACDIRLPLSVRWTAIDVLSESQDRSSIPILDRLLDDGVADCKALSALCAIGGATEVRKLVSDRRPSPGSVPFLNLIESVAEMGLTDCIPLLEARYTEADESDKLPLASTLVRLGCLKFVSMVENAMTGDVSGPDLGCILSALPHMDEAKRPQYIAFVRHKALASDEALTRSYAIDCLCAMGGISTAELIKLSRLDNDRLVALDALEKCLQLPLTKDDVRELLSMAEEAENRGCLNVMFSVFQAIALSGDPEWVAYLKDQANRGKGAMKLMAACALWGAGHGEFKAQVIEGISGMAEKTRDYCAWAFRCHAGPEDMWTVLQLLDNKDIDQSIHRKMLGTFFELLYNVKNGK
jgi:hypothetical protein